jgi:hypothetical protein
MSLDIYLRVPPCGHCGRGDEEEVWQASPTYNLSPMWHSAGVPFERGVEGKTAAEILPRLASSLAELQANPEKYRAMNPPNGWGTYEQLIDVVSGMIKAARAHPLAVVGAWR